MSETATEAQPQPAEPTTPTPAEAAPKGTPGETPEQTIAALRAALAKANGEAQQSRVKAKDDFRAQMRELLGEKADEVKPEDAIGTLRQELADLRQETRLAQVARTFGITDETDLSLLRSAQSPDLMNAWAERLKPAAPTPAAPAPPATDPGQGITPTADAADAEYQQFFPST